MNNVGKTIKKIDGTVIFPEWMQIVSSIEKDVIKKDNVKSKILYHYTGLDGFMSIMQHRDFWISNIRFMNDSQEFENGKKVCKKIVELRMEKEDKYKLFLQKILEICDEPQSRGHFTICNQDIFALSFCDNGDILTLWQFYGNTGVSIGFENKITTFDAITFMNEDEYNEEICHINPKEMLPHNETILHLHKVIYEDKDKENIFEEIINIGIVFLEKYGMNVIDLCVDGISDALFYFFALMKDEHFKHEQESRFLYYTNKNDKRIHYRKKGNIILPYLKLKILDVNCRPHDTFPVSDIVIAPGSQQNYVADSVKYFLDRSGYEYLSDKVRTSQIPYRE